MNWIPPWEDLTPLDAAEREEADSNLVRWLLAQNAKRWSELS